MKPRHRISRTAIELIKRFEGYRRKAAQLPDGRWTIGYGHTLTAREGAEVSEEDAEALLLYDLIAISHSLNDWTYAPLSQNQFDALASFVFNIGLDNFRRSSVLKRINEGSLIQAACGMELWRKAHFEGERIVIDALVRRRSAEKALFLTPAGDAWIAAPSPVLRPALDADSAGLVPREAPTPVTATLEGECVLVLRDEPAPPPAPPEEEAPSPALAAAEAVTARLQAIFQEPGEEPEASASAAGPASGPEQAEAPEAQPFVLEPPRDFPGEPKPVEEDDAPESVAVEAPRGPDLFDQPPPANDLAAEGEQPAEALHGEPTEQRRRVIDDTVPYEFEPPMVQPLPGQPKASIFSLLALAVLGLAFFAGGVFWALNARTGPTTGFISPLLVGWLAGLAGVGFFAVSIFLLLERLGKAAERGRRSFRR